MKIYPVPKDHAMKMFGGIEVWLHAFLTSALNVVERLASRRDLFIPGERCSYTNWIGDWVGPQSRSGFGSYEKSSYSCWESSPGRNCEYFVE
jgi:hypothetical protein